MSGDTSPPVYPTLVLELTGLGMLMGAGLLLARYLWRLDPIDQSLEDTAHALKLRFSIVPPQVIGFYQGRSVSVTLIRQPKAVLLVAVGTSLPDQKALVSRWENPPPDLFNVPRLIGLIEEQRRMAEELENQPVKPL